jgi:ATP phosphoribosyltransferase regulatory subunit
VEFRGFRYHTGVSLTVYAPGRHEELGRGGRYVCGDAEPATGLTLYPDAILRAAPPPPARLRVFIPAGSDPALAAALRAQGFATIAALAASDDDSTARAQGCTHVLRNGAAAPLEKEIS